MERMQKVSIIISTRNRGKFLPTAIKSALAQSYKNFEIIIADDASTDNTQEVALEYVKKDNRIKYFRQNERIGIAPTWKKAFFEYATGDLITVLNDDDELIDDEFIEKSVELFKKYENQNVVCVFSNVVYKIEQIGAENIAYPNGFDEFLNGEKLFDLETFIFTDNGSIYKREVLNMLELFNKDITSLDLEMLYKLMLIGNFCYLDSTTYQHNFEPSCISFFSKDNIVKNFDALCWISLVGDFAKKNCLLTDDEILGWKQKRYSYEANRIAWEYGKIGSGYGEFLHRCYELVSKNEKVAIYGTKEAAKTLYDSFKRHDIEKQIVNFIDDYESGELFGIQIVNPADIKNDFTIVIPSGNIDTLRSIWLKIGSLRFKRVIDVMVWRNYLNGLQNCI